MTGSVSEKTKRGRELSLSRMEDAAPHNIRAKIPPTTTPSTGSFLNVQSRRANDFSVFPFRKQWQDPPNPLIEILEQTRSVRNPFFFHFS